MFDPTSRGLRRGAPDAPYRAAFGAHGHTCGLWTPLADIELAPDERARRRFSRLLASGEVAEAFAYADRRGLIRETSDDETLFARAAGHYVNNRVKGVETLVVIPFWDEIERFNARVRPALPAYYLSIGVNRTKSFIFLAELSFTDAFAFVRALARAFLLQRSVSSAEQFREISRHK